MHALVQFTLLIERALYGELTVLDDFFIRVHGIRYQTGVMRILQDETDSLPNPCSLCGRGNVYLVQIGCNLSGAFAGEEQLVNHLYHDGLRLDRADRPAAAVQLTALVAVGRAAADVAALFFADFVPAFMRRRIILYSCRDMNRPNSIHSSSASCVGS